MTATSGLAILLTLWQHSGNHLPLLYQPLHFRINRLELLSSQTYKSVTHQYGWSSVFMIQEAHLCGTIVSPQPVFSAVVIMWGDSLSITSLSDLDLVDHLTIQWSHLDDDSSHISSIIGHWTTSQLKRELEISIIRSGYWWELSWTGLCTHNAPVWLPLMHLKNNKSLEIDAKEIGITTYFNQKRRHSC